MQYMKHRIGLYIKKKFGAGNVYRVLVKLNTFLFHKRVNTEKRSFGDKNPDKVFFIVKPTGKEAGLIAMFWDALEKIEYAITKGYYPVVDIKNYECQYTINDGFNVWEKFFKQPFGYGLDEVYKSKNVIVMGNTENIERQLLPVARLRDNYDREANKKKRDFIQKYASVNEDIMNEAEKYLLNFKGENILGVFLRGTDFVALKPSGHCVQPTPDLMFNKIDEFLNKYEINHIFLVTEDEKIKESFQKKYGDLLLENLGKTISNYDDKDFICYYLEPDEKVDNAKIYLEKLLILSKCDYLITSLANGSIYSLANNCEFKDTYIFDLGTYK